MRRVKLDKIDLKILRDLQEDGSLKNVHLARRVGISAPPCLRRVQALESAGFITGYHAQLSADKLGYALTVFAMIGLANQNETELSKFEQTVRSYPQVREAYLIMGEFDFLLKIAARDSTDYQAFLTQILTKIENVDRVKSSLAVKTSKWEPGVPVDVETGLEIEE